MKDLQNLKVDRLQQLINVNLTVTENYDNFDVVLQRLLHAIEIITNCEATSFLIYDPATKNLTFRLVSGQNTHELIGLVVPSGRGIAHMVARNKKGMIVNNIEEMSNEHFMEIDRKLDFKTINLMAFPILDSGGNLIGVVEACNKKNQQNFTNEDFQILLIFCQQAERTVRHALKIHTLKNRVSTLSEKLDAFRFPDFVYGSKEMEIKFNFVKKIANSKSQVLICGDIGTGKTNLATQIHRYSERSEYVIEYINCSDLAMKDKREQEIAIFGTEKNHQYGIRQRKPSVLETIEKGTIVFQEIGQLALNVQEKILTLIKHNTYLPLGGTKEKTADIRVLSTTSQKLDKMVELHKFNEELYYQLNSLNIFLAPLRLRPDDITPLAQYYFKKSIYESKKIIREIDSNVFYILKRYSWPNNISELINVIRRAVWSCEGDRIKPHDLSIHSFSFEDDFIDQDEKGIMTLQDAVNEFKKQYIYKSLLHYNWNHTQTAKVLDIQRSYLSKLVKLYNLKTRATKKQKLNASSTLLINTTLDPEPDREYSENNM